MSITPEECAQKILYLLQNKDIAEKMGQAAREHVRQNFLITKHLEDYLDLMLELEKM